jgi:N6-adenosine-specific RNA methylase IME4
MPKPARVIVADAPWFFADRLGKRGAEANYPTLSVAELCRFPLPKQEPDCFLFFWRVASKQREALDVCRAWGFEVKTDWTWVKTRPCKRCEGTGRAHHSLLWCTTCEGHGWKLHFGMGRYSRAATETCIVATRGKPEPLVHDERDVFFAPVGRHSEKPNEFYEKVERFARGPYVELFSRRERPNWRCYGNELTEAHP